MCTRRGPSRSLAIYLLLSTLAWLAPSSAPAAALGDPGRGPASALPAARPAPVDTTLALRDVVQLYPRAAADVRLLLQDQADLERDLDLAHIQAAADSARAAIRLEATAAQLAAARDQLPRWFERPGVVAGVTAVLVSVVIVGSMQIVVD